MTAVAVVVPTFRRPEPLRRCLEGLLRQQTPPDEVVVVVRTGDAASRAAVEELQTRLATLRPVSVAKAGVLAAMREGVAATSAEVVAFIDDDAVPSETWIADLLGAFTDSGIGLVGGRDVVEGEAWADRLEVGVIDRWANAVGNHHRGTGPARLVDTLKGVNMAARRTALALPTDLRGAGAQVYWEIATCLWAKERGWAIVYDPGITVAHFPAPRHDADQRRRPSAEAVYDEAYNYQLVLGVRPELGRRALVVGLAFGSAGGPGLVRVALGIVRGERNVVRRFGPAARGRIAGFRDSRRGPPTMWAAVDVAVPADTVYRCTTSRA